MTKIRGIDVSHWQRTVDFEKVKSAGYTFVMLNAGYGRYAKQKDESFERNYTAAKKAGLDVGAYWYSYALTETEALEEAKTFVSCIKGKKFEYPLAFDIEDTSQNALSSASVDSIITAFCEHLEKCGYYTALYSYADFLSRKVSTAVKNRFDIWVAHYDVARPTAAQYGMWQYTSKGSVPGVSGYCDCNYAYKDYPTIIKEKSLNGYKPPQDKTLDKSGYKKGDSSDGVLSMKYLLMLAKKKGLHSVTLDHNGIFGKGTQKAVNALLKSWGYVQNGTAGKNFINKLGEELLK